MSTVELVPFDVSLQSGHLVTSVLVGDPAIMWSDGSDSTYATGTGNGSQFDIMQSSIVSLSGAIVAAEVHCRVSSVAGGDLFQPLVTDLPLFDGDYSAVFGGFGSASNYTGAAAVPTDRVCPLSDGELGGLIAALSTASPMLSFISSSGTPDITVYGASLFVTLSDEAPPDPEDDLGFLFAPTVRHYLAPLRIHPRSDGLGTSSAPRVTGSRSIQSSNRVVGGYL